MLKRRSIACIAYEDGLILIAHRNSPGDMGNRWEFPGGKVENGETDEQAIIREFNEEFGVIVRVGQFLTEGNFVHSGNEMSLRAYRIFVPHKGDHIPYTLSEHYEYQWIDPSKIPSLNFVDSDLSIYVELMKCLADTEQK